MSGISESEESKTRLAILEMGKAEFLEKGFKDASLRNIVKNAGVTTGAFYGYFSNKEALFAALVEDDARAVMQKYVEAQEYFTKFPEGEQTKRVGVDSGEYLDWMIDYIYDHYDSFKLIICRSEGAAYADFVNAMVEIEVEATYRFFGVLKRVVGKEPNVDKTLCHILCSGMFDSIMEIVRHDMPKERAVEYVRQIRRFHIAGWNEIMGL